MLFKDQYLATKWNDC